MDSRARGGSRRGEPARYPQELDTFRPRVTPRSRSISPVPRHRATEPELREIIQLSGANGIPTAPGRSFPAARTSRSYHQARADLEMPRYQASTHLAQANEPMEPHDNSRRRELDAPPIRELRSPEGGFSGWPRRPDPLVSPIYPSHHRLETRARSPSPSRHASTSFQDLPRGVLQHDLYPSERSRTSSASNRVFSDHQYRPAKTVEMSESSRRNNHSRYDAYRPSASLASETNGSRYHTTRRHDVYAARDQGSHRLEHSRIEPRRSQAAKTSMILPESPAIHSKGFNQPDLYRPPPTSRDVSRLSPPHPPSTKPHPMLDLEENPNKNEPLPEPPTSQSSGNAPSGEEAAIKHDPKASPPSTLQHPDKIESLSEPSTTPVDKRPDTEEAPNFYEATDSTNKNGKASSDIVELDPSQSALAADSSKKVASLAKRLGPMADKTVETDKLSPPAKKHRRNPVEPVEIPDVPNDLSHNTRALPLTNDTSLDSIAASISPDSCENPPNQSVMDEKFKLVNPVLETSLPSPTIAQDKGISLRGRAARKPEQDDNAEKPRPMIEDRSFNKIMPTGNGSLRDRIQDLNFSPGQPGRSRPSHYGGPPQASRDFEAAKRMDASRRIRSRVEADPPTSRHISERISGMRFPAQTSPTTNRNPSSRYTPRQSDSGWNGRRARYP